MKKYRDVVTVKDFFKHYREVFGDEALRRLTNPKSPFYVGPSHRHKNPESILKVLEGKAGYQVVQVIRDILKSPGKFTAPNIKLYKRPKQKVHTKKKSVPNQSAPDDIDISIRSVFSVPLVYTTSDLHMGNNRDTNDCDGSRLSLFEKLVKFVDKDADKYGQQLPCNFVLNGDIFDLWAAAPINNYMYPAFSLEDAGERFEEILTYPDNQDYFFKPLRERFLRPDRPNRTLIYLIGNHDDPLRRYPPLLLRLQSEFDPRRFLIADNYYNPVLKLHIEHGHMHDSDNKYDPNKFCVGQIAVEHIANKIEDQSLRGTMPPLDEITKRKPKIPDWLGYFDQIYPASEGYLYLKYWQNSFNEPNLVDSIMPIIVFGLVEMGKGRLVNLLPLSPQILVAAAAVWNAKNDHLDYRKIAKQLLRRNKVVVMGHTHVADAEPKLNRPRPVTEQYVNTGTSMVMGALQKMGIGASLLGNRPPLPADQSTLVRIRQFAGRLIEVDVANWGDIGSGGMTVGTGWQQGSGGVEGFSKNGLSGRNQVIP